MSRVSIVKTPCTKVSHLQLKGILNKNHYQYYLMLVPGIVFFIVFSYIPMAGLILAFKEYSFAKGIWGSPWASPDILKWFRIAFSGDAFWQVLKNTLIISFMKLLFQFPAPIILAILLNEVRAMYFKRVVQSLVYLPHFISWVVISGIVFTILSSTGGALNFIGFNTSILTNPQYFRWFIVGSEIWKEAGWGTVIYLAAITGISVDMYEAAIIDGAGRFQKIWYITLPSIVSTVIIVFLLRIGHILSAGFDQIFVLYSPVTYSVADIIDTYVYRTGLAAGRFPLATAVGAFKSVVGLILIISSNKIIRKLGENGLW